MVVDWGPKRSEKHGEQWMRGPTAPLSVALRTRFFGNGRQLAAKLLLPVVYDAVAHDRAESKADRMREPNAPRGAAQSQAYAPLSEVVPVQTVTTDEIMRFSIPKLTPWGIVVVAAR